jgi:NTE family protein
MINENLRVGVGNNHFEDTQIPLFISATNYRTGQQVTFSKGEIYPAVRASIALPLIFPPVEIGDELYAAGYLSEPLPIGVAIRAGADVILAMGFEASTAIKPNSFTDYVQNLSNVMSNNMMHAGNSFYDLAHHADVILIIPEFGANISMFATYRVPDIIEAGEREGEKILPQLKALLAE